jgi:hypothetical protein
MKIRLNSAILIVSALMAFGFYAVRAQQNGVRHASDFSSVEYFEPPHQQQMKSRLSGAEASPQAGGLLLIKKLKLEMFKEDGTLEYEVEAPDCIYDTLHSTASSPGPLQFQTGDGKFRVEGEGFLWRQADQFLTISNNVRTVIENAPESETKP